jgi:hypothetical protein
LYNKSQNELVIYKTLPFMDKIMSQDYNKLLNRNKEL